MNDTDYAWAAGLVDGEGCFCITITNPKKQGKTSMHKFFLVIVNTHKETIDRLKEILVVGSLHSQQRNGDKRCYRLVISSLQAIGAIKLIRPYLVTKARDADISPEFLSLGKTLDCMYGVSETLYNKREELRLKMREGKPAAGRKRESGPIGMQDTNYQLGIKRKQRLDKGSAKPRLPRFSNKENHEPTKLELLHQV